MLLFALDWADVVDGDHADQGFGMGQLLGLRGLFFALGGFGG